MEDLVIAVFRVVFRIVAYAIVQIVWELLLQTLFSAIGAGWRKILGR